MILDGLRVLDRTTEIAGPYCTKLLADAGADVVKVEAAGGDALRSWRSGALFEFLNASKRSVLHATDGALLDGADVLVTNDPRDRALRSEQPALVVVTITPYGCDGPWSGQPWTEFTLQAACGSTGARGVPEEPPLAAGGRLGEWVTGSYAAVAALAAAREAGRSGRGEHVDVSLLDCMAVTMTTFPSVFSSFLGWPRMRGTGRMIDVPSVEPTSDGYVVVTTNAAQQFRDFLVLIGHGELVDDAGLANAMVRFKQRAAFLEMVHEYTTKRTTAEVLEEAALLRIPSGPVLNGGTVEGFEQFVAREVFVPSPSGRFRQPRVPYRISGLEPRPFARPPEVGEHSGAIEWPARAAATGGEWALPLQGVRVLDLTAWWAGPSAPHALAALGADVVKVESAARPDGARFTTMKPPSEDGWWEWGPLFHGVNTGKRGITLDLATSEGLDVLHRLLAATDVLIENFTPRVMEQFGLGWSAVHARHPKVVMVRMPAFGLDGPWRERTGFAQTMECMAGMAWVTGWADGPPVLVRGTCDPLAGMHGAFATLVALAARDRDGEGRLVEAAMVESALNVAAEQVVEHGATGVVLGREGNRSAVAAPQGVYRCEGEDRWLAIAAANDEQRRALERLTGAAGEPEAWCASMDADEAAELLVRAGVPAAVVIPTRDVVHNPQVRHRGLFEAVDHPLTGTHELPGMPFRFSRVERWLRRAAPTLGQHNDEVLSEAGLDAEAIATLRATHVIAEALPS